MDSGERDRVVMLITGIRDLIKPQWRAVLEELKLSGGMPVSDLSRVLDSSYVTVKSHCEQLTKAGYLIRTRLPRTEVGRPEIFYSLARKADELFPQAGVAFTLEFFEELRLMHGDNAPEKLLFQYYQKHLQRLAKVLEKFSTPAEKAFRLVAIRNKEGCVSQCMIEPGEPVRIVEIHNPLERIHQRYPRSVAMEHRMLEQLIGVRLARQELPGGRESTPRVVFEFV